MKRISNYFILSFLLCVLCFFAANASGQAISKISSKCPNPSKLFANVTIITIGDINLNPCAGRSVYINGVPITPGGIGGSGTATHIPVFSAPTTLADTPNTWDGTTFNWSNTAGTATFPMALRPGSGNGTFQVGNSQIGFFVDQAGSSIAGFVPDAGGTFTVENHLADSGIFYASTGKLVTLQTAAAGSVLAGDTASAGSGDVFTVAPAINLFHFSSTSANANMNYDGVNVFSYLRTITAAGTTGAQTINRPSGTVNFAAGASTLVVTNNTVGVNSIVFPIARRADATCFVAAVTPAAGSFTITMTAPCTAETSVGFLVTN